jgi:hypothetical protein
MSYVLVATFLTRGECKKIQSKAVNVSLTKYGFSRTTSRSVVFGSPWFGGLGWRHLFFEQGIQHVLLLLKHLQTPDHFQSLLIICLHWYQVVAGVSFCPFSRPRVKMPYLGSAWLDSTRVFLAHSAATLHIDQASLPALQRQHDACIMDGILELGLSTTSLERINCCRLYLRVATLSNIRTLHGDQIECKDWLGLGRMASSQADWPVQPRPHDKSWGLWRSAISTSVCTKKHRYVLASRPGILTKCLGLWLNTSTPQTSTRLTALFEHNTQQLFIPDQENHGRYHQYSTATSLDRHFAHFDTNTGCRRIPSTDIPVDTVPVMPTEHGSFLCILRSRPPHRMGTAPTRDRAATSSAYTQQQPLWKRELITGAFPTAEFDTLGQHLVSGTRLLLCTDGGAKGNRGAYGWVISTDKKLLWECSAVPAPGWFTNSFRSEGVGQLTILVFIEAYLE